jgi:hypothetical protein
MLLREVFHMKQFMLVLAVMLLTACGPTEAELQATAVAAATATEAADPCSPTKIRAYGVMIERELEVYEGLLEIAGSTSRIALAGPRQELQKQRFVVKDIETPECLNEYHSRILYMMEQQELGYKYFVSDTSDAGEAMAAVTILLADDILTEVKEKVSDLIEGKIPVLPNVTPTPTA